MSEKEELGKTVCPIAIKEQSNKYRALQIHENTMLRTSPTKIPLKELDLLEIEERKKLLEAAKGSKAGPPSATVTPPVRSAAERIGIAGGH